MYRVETDCTVLVRTLAASHWRFRNLKTHGRTPLDQWWARSRRLYLHSTTQHRNTKTNIHASSGIRTHDPSNQEAKTYVSDRAAAGTGWNWIISLNNLTYCQYSDIMLYWVKYVCAITASGVPGGNFVSMNLFSTLCGWLAQRLGWRVKGWIWPSEQPRSAKANSWLDYEMGDREC
jgi:hypothetical protein